MHNTTKQFELYRGGQFIGEVPREHNTTKQLNDLHWKPTRVILILIVQ